MKVVFSGLAALLFMDIRILHLDTGGEPACCSSYMAILSANPNDELGDRQCNLLVSDANGLGFMDIAVDRVRSTYDTIKGLLLSVPVSLYGDGSTSTEKRINVRINQALGTVTIEK